jgi:putative FmdB family regulatory protein
VNALPTYAYRCATCSHEFERFQKMSDEPVKECEECGSEVQRVLFPVAVHFKGSGFYTTDYARKKTMASSGAKNAASDVSSGSEGGSSASSDASSDCSACSKEGVCPSAA